MNPPETIEDLILRRDWRGIGRLRAHLSPDYCVDAARCVQTHAGTVMVVTGFFEIVPQVPETDGPPGAIALCHALRALGRRVVLVSDRYTVPYLEALDSDCEVAEFPIADPSESARAAKELLQEYQPAVVVAVERCSVNGSGRYLNISGQDITKYTARLDYLFVGPQPSIGIGDAGNEIGMGKLSRQIAQLEGLAGEPAVTPTTHLIVTTVSNWGAYGLIAGLSVCEQRDLLPPAEAAEHAIRTMVELGAVDGELLESVCFVDGFELAESLDILERLRNLTRASGVRC